MPPASPDPVRALGLLGRDLGRRVRGDTGADLAPATVPAGGAADPTASGATTCAAASDAGTPPADPASSPPVLGAPSAGQPAAASRGEARDVGRMLRMTGDSIGDRPRALVRGETARHRVLPPVASNPEAATDSVAAPLIWLSSAPTSVLRCARLALVPRKLSPVRGRGALQEQGRAGRRGGGGAAHGMTCERCDTGSRHADTHVPVGDVRVTWDGPNLAWCHRAA